MKNRLKVFSLITIVFLLGLYTIKSCRVDNSGLDKNVEYGGIIKEDTLIKNKEVVKTKQDIDFTGTTQGEKTKEEMLSIEPDYIYYDTIEAQAEADSIDAYLAYWYEYLDTNNDGDIDVVNYRMGCGGEIPDTIIEWLDE